jgi:Flp pilus assembly protein TadG
VPRRRGGATLVETAVALALLLTVLLSTVDLGYGIFRHHILAQATRQMARRATVRGSLADRLGSWGPETVSILASDDLDMARQIAPSLVGWELADVTIQVDWIDGGNDAEKGHRVRVRLSAPYEPMMALVLGSQTITLSATSTMRIAH